jgi:GNAT superfamily N-acetyltransferase
MRIRQARAYDEHLFRKLWALYLKEAESKGSHLAADETNLEIAVRLFRAYVAGHRRVKVGNEWQESPFRGVVLLHGDCSVIMAGESVNESIFIETLGSSAMVWGNYVLDQRRGEGIGSELARVALKKLRRMGFDTVNGYVNGRDLFAVATAAAIGARAAVTLYTLDVRKESD